MGVELDEYTIGRSFCPNGHMAARFFISPKVDVNTEIFKITLKIASETSTTAKELQVKFAKFPVELSTKVDSNADITIDSPLDVQKGHGFDFKIVCGLNSFDFYLNGTKVHAVTDLHASGELLTITKIKIDEPQKDTGQSTGCTCTHYENTFRKL